MATETQIKNFTAMVAKWDADRLIGHFAMCVTDNQDFSRYEEIEIVKAEMKRRMTPDAVRSQ